jgi:CrcB protein
MPGTLPLISKFALLAGAGALGTLARYILSGLAHRVCGENFPWGTLAVNMLGCLLFGLVWPLAEERLVISGQMRLIILTGFMGAFTTFSTFAFETSNMLSLGQWGAALANLTAQNVCGILAILAGLALGRLL